MKTAVLRNIGGAVTSEKAASASASANGTVAQRAGIDVEATGMRNGGPVRLIGHFVAHGKRFYQVVILGKPSAVVPEQTDQVPILI